jgi:putative spermidine/putrescine transport system ATP-binding protein
MQFRATRLSLDAVTRRFGPLTAVDNVSLDVAEGEFLSLLGPSGCGKTTLLRLIAGFEHPDAGRMISNGRDITRLPPQRRNFGVVFQSYALFPHMTVLENVGYGLKVRGVRRETAVARARAALDRVAMSAAENRYPSQISGGQQQRIALARALVIEPEILLLDEPLSALDKNLREEMQVELRQIQQRIGITTIFVTHDQEEALTLSDRVAVMRRGHVLQIDAPRAIYDRPINRFVATFLGTTNLLSGRMAPGAVRDGVARLEIDGHSAGARSGDAPPQPGSETILAVRPEDVRLVNGGNGLACTVQDVLFQGHRITVLLETCGGQKLRAFCHPADGLLGRGTKVHVTWDPAAASLLPPEPEAA